MSIDKTVNFSVDGKNVIVAELPMQLRKQFELYDEFRERQHSDAINLELSTMATNVKHLQLQEMIRNILETAEKQPSGDVGNNV